MNPRILVIGGLAAGPSAASKAKRTNPNADVLLIEQGEHISYGICEVPYYVGNVITDPNLLVSYTPQRLTQVKGVSVKTLHRAEEIVTTKKKVIVRNLDRNKTEELSYDKLILATGSRARNLEMTGERARNVFHVKSLDDGFAIRRFIEEEKPRKGVVIGGGYIGMEMCEALRVNGIETTMLHRSDVPMSGLERETRSAVLAALKKGKVDFQASQRAKELPVDQSGRVTEVRTDSGAFPVDLVILCLGVIPNVELGMTARLRLGPNKGILTDQRQTTSVDTIFAAGDCCEVKNIVNNKWMYLPLATNASKQGWVAGENAAGANASFKGAIRAIAVKVFDLEIAQVGISSVEAEKSGFQPVVEKIEGDSRVRFYPGNSTVNVILIADKKSGRLLGANVYGGAGSVLRADVLAVAIQQKMTIDEITRVDLIYAPPFSPLWDPILIAAQQTMKLVKGRR